MVPAHSGKTDQPRHIPPQICIESHSNANLYPVFYLKPNLYCTEPFRKKLDGSCVTSLFLGNNRQHIQICAKRISSWVRKVLSIVRDMSLGTLWDAAASIALAAGVSLITWPEFLLQLDTIFLHISLLQMSTSILGSMLSWALVSSQLVGKCQTLTYINSYRYVGLSGHISPKYQANSSPIVCVVFAIDSTNYCSGKQGPTAKHLCVNCQYFHQIVSLNKRKCATL